MLPPPARPQRAGVALKITAAALLALHFALGWSLRAPGITAGGDNAAYALLGRSLRHFEYQSSWLAGSPPHGQYPPVYPAILAIATASEPGRAPIGVALNLILSTAALGVFALLCWRWSPASTVGALAVAAANPALLGLAGKLMSEPLFMLLLLVTLWCAVARPSRWPLAALAAIAAALTRSIGVAVIAGLLVEWARTRRWPPALGLVLAALLTLGPWFIRAARVPQQLAGQSYIGDALHRRQASAAADSTSIGTPRAIRTPRDVPLVRRAGAQMVSYASRTLPSILVVPTIPGTRIDNVLWVILLAGLGAVGAVMIFRRQPVVPLVVSGYLGILLLWPYVVGRFLVPVLPLLAFFVMEGARSLGERVARLPAWAPVAVLSGVLMGAGLAADRRELGTLAHCDRARAYEAEGCFSTEEVAFFQTLADANRLAPAGAVLLTPKPPVAYYRTGHPALDDVYAESLNADQLDEYLRTNRTDYALLSRVHLRFGKIGAAMRSRCADWRVVVNRESEGAVLLRRRTAEADTAASSCAVLGRIDLGGK